MGKGADGKSEQDNIWYGFRIDELRLLLAAAGAGSWYGPADGSSGKAIRQEDVNRMLADLYRKNIVTFEDGRLVMADEQKMITETIRDASAVATSYCGVKSGVPYTAYFCGGKAVIMRTDIAGSGRIIVRMIDGKDWPEFLLSESQMVCRPAGASTDGSCQSDASSETELEINGEGLRRAATELEGCGDALKRISSELYSTISKADRAAGNGFDRLDEAQKTLEINGLGIGRMAEMLVRIADEAEQAEKMILDHEALMKAARMRSDESDLTGITETLEKAVRK